MSKTSLREFLFDPQEVDLPVCVCVRVGRNDLLLPKDDLVVTPYIQINRSWDPEVSSWLSKLAIVSNVFLDVGTMIGFFGLQTFESNPFLKIHLVDPDEKNLRIAYENVRHQKNTHLYNCAVSPKNTYGWGILRDSNNHGNSRISQFTKLNQTTSVSTIDLGTAIQEVGADLVKIDIQGLEEDILAEISREVLPETISIISEITLSEWKNPKALPLLLQNFKLQRFKVYLVQGTQQILEIDNEILETVKNVLQEDHFDLIFDRGGRINL